MADNKYRISVPVLLVGFNRPEIIRQSIDNLKHFSIDKLYVAIDGPRPGNVEDPVNVSKVCDIVNNLDFCSSVKYRFNEENLGAEITISSAISWVLDEEEYVIVLEDDVIAHQSFFQFMQDMLFRYVSDKRVAMVSGCNYTPMQFPNDEDYCFCQSGHTSGGWATWKRVWCDYNIFEEINNDYLKDSFLLSISPNKRIAKKRKKDYLKLKDNGMNNNWDVMFGYYRNTRRYLSIVPSSHLTSNIGIYGLHQKGVRKTNFRKIDDDFIATHHPQEVVWNKDYDIYHYNHWIKVPLCKIIKGYSHGVLNKLKVLNEKINSRIRSWGTSKVHH